MQCNWFLSNNRNISNLHSQPSFPFHIFHIFSDLNQCDVLRYLQEQIGVNVREKKVQHQKLQKRSIKKMRRQKCKMNFMQISAFQKLILPTSVICNFSAALHFGSKSSLRFYCQWQNRSVHRRVTQKICSIKSTIFFSLPFYSSPICFCIVNKLSSDADVQYDFGIGQTIKRRFFHASR